MKLLSLIAVSVFLVACASPEGIMRKKREIHAAKESFRLLGHGPTDPEMIALEKCAGVRISIYDNATGTNSERYKKAQQAHDKCKKDSGY